MKVPTEEFQNYRYNDIYAYLSSIANSVDGHLQILIFSNYDPWSNQDCGFQLAYTRFGLEDHDTPLTHLCLVSHK